MCEQPQHISRETHAAGVIERWDNHILIATFESSEILSRLWQFPRGRVKPGEPPEAALRRVAKRNLGITVEVLLGQPPLIAEVEGKSAELRYFFCNLTAGEAVPGPYAEIQWIPRVHLQEYDFDSASQMVADWVVRS